jgi:hypothetical protein
MDADSRDWGLSFYIAPNAYGTRKDAALGFGYNVGGNFPGVHKDTTDHSYGLYFEDYYRPSADLNTTEFFLAMSSRNNLWSRRPIQFNIDPRTGYVEGYINTDAMIFKNNTGATEWMRVNVLGNLGIGSVNPTSQIVAARGGNEFRWMDIGPYIQISDTANQVGFGTYSGSGGTGWIGSISNHPFVIRTNNAVSMAFDSLGSVTMGDPTKTNSFTIKGTIIIKGNAPFSSDITHRAGFYWTHDKFVMDAYQDGVGFRPIEYDFGTSLSLYPDGVATNALVYTSSGGLTIGTSYTSGAPNGGTAAAWKFGTVVTTTALVPSTTTYIQVDVGGTLYKLATIP